MRASPSPGLGMPMVACAVVLLLLGALALATGGDGSGEEGAATAAAATATAATATATAATATATATATAAAPRTASVATIARRVERIRGLRYSTLPRPVTVSPARARAEGLRDLDRSYPPAARRADEALYTLLGLLAPADDLRVIAASVYGGQVAGFYDPRSGALRIVDGAAAPNRVIEETTLAHELTHALEDQRFGLELESRGSSGDRALAYSALVEGTATASMTEYQRRHFRPSQAIGGAAAAALTAPSTASLPPFITAQLLFPYLDGERLASRLFATGAGSWRLVDLAERVRPPASTEQVLHPDAYLRLEGPARVRLGDLRGVLGAGWTRAARGTFGEWQTRELLRRGTSSAVADQAATGWGGDRYELWERAGEHALVLRWTWDSARDAREFRDALADTRSVLRGRAVAITRGSGTAVTLAMAPTPALAHRLTGR